MTRKDYELIAKALKTIREEMRDQYARMPLGMLGKHGPKYIVDRFEDTIISSLTKDNPRFNPARFRAAANLD